MKTQFLNRPGGLIAFDDTGAPGPLVVCVPGMGDLRQEYRFLVPQLAEAGFRAVTMDLRGHGESSTGWPEYSASAVGSDIVALVRHLDAGPAVVIGTSMAAESAVWAALAATDLIAGQVLIGPFVRSHPVSLLHKVMITLLMGGPWGAAAWTIFYNSLYRTSSPADLPQYVASLRANLQEPGRFAVVRQLMWRKPENVEARLADVQSPTLVLMGTRDPDFKDPAEEARWLAEHLRGAHLMVEGAGHYPHAEMPETAGPAIVDFLLRLTAPALP
jgi:pimeloyl-ACP methyl ester carboxylesterase